jgi:dihydrofolate reductase
MARLICTGITSLDGYIADKDGKFDWCAPDPEVHAFVNDLERGVGTQLYGRRLYEVMAVWDTFGPDEDLPDAERDYAAIWQAADKVVYSRTLAAPATARTRLEPEFDPEAVRRMKERADRDLSIGGPDLAASALRAGLVDEIRHFVYPVSVGGGTRFLPADLRLDLELTDHRRFACGAVFLRYDVKA